MPDATVLISFLVGAALSGAVAVVFCNSHWRRQVAGSKAAHEESLTSLRTLSDQRIAEVQAAQRAATTAALKDAELRHEQASRTEREQLLQQHQTSLQAAERRYAEQLKKLESPLTVLVHPFVNTSLEKGLIRNSSVVECGYKYQLMVQGIPCFPPHDVVVERQSKVEIDEQALAAWGAKALQFAEAAAQVKGGGVAGKLISVAKTVVQSRI